MLNLYQIQIRVGTRKTQNGSHTATKSATHTLRSSNNKDTKLTIRAFMTQQRITREFAKCESHRYKLSKSERLANYWKARKLEAKVECIAHKMLTRRC